MGAADTGPADADLMSRWCRGDRAAFEVLVRRWQPPVARFLARLAPEPSVVADLCQEVFLRVYQAQDRYVESGTFSTWLYRIALNVARDAGRRRRRWPALLAGHEPAVAGEPSEAVGRQEVSEAVLRAVADLPQPLREVLVLRHYEGMRFEAIARLTGLPASTLKSRFAAAISRLRIVLQAFDEAPQEFEP